MMHPTFPQSAARGPAAARWSTAKAVLVAITTCAATVPWADDDAARTVVHKTFVNEAGNTVQTVRGKGTDQAGTEHRARGYRVTDSDGNLLRAAGNHAYQTDDGTVGLGQRRLRLDDEGNQAQAARQAQRNTNGDVRARRAARETDADGNVIRAGRDRANRNADGTGRAAQGRLRTRDDGATVTKRRQVRGDGAGNRTVRKQRRVIE